VISSIVNFVVFTKLSIVIPSQDGIHAKPLAFQLVDRHGYRPAAVL